MMQPSAHEVVDVVTMRHGFVPAGRAVLVCATGLRSALHGIGGVDGDDMFVDVILMHMMEVAIMQIIDVPFVADAGMSTVCAMLMGMVGMVILGAGCHDCPLFICDPPGTVGHCSSAACFIALCANRRTWVSENA
jgi:hypothetical protein